MKEVGRMKTKELNKGEIIITSQDLHKPIYEFFKRILDVICSVVALIVLSPAFLVTALAVRSDGGPAFYKQTRVGKNNTHFEMYKFRSMCKNAENLQDDLMKYNEMDGPVFKIKGDPRITKVGKFIRKYSIDELPQLLNIVKEPEVGEIYNGLVKTIQPFGAFVEILPGKDGLCHISKLANHRVEKVEDVVKEGDWLKVKVMEVDKKTGKISLSHKDAIEEGEE